MDRGLSVDWPWTGAVHASRARGLLRNLETRGLETRPGMGAGDCLGDGGPRRDAPLRARPSGPAKPKPTARPRSAPTEPADEPEVSFDAP